MKRMACGTAATLALVGLAACFSNPSLDLNTSNFHIVQPTPAVTFTKVGDSIQLRLRLVNDVNNGAITSFVVAGVPAGISVRYDDKFRPYYTSGDTLVVPVDKDMQQYYVKGLLPGKWTFTVTATANTAAPAATITVTVESKDLGAALSRTTGLNAGDTVTITAPAGLVFSQTSAVTFATGVWGIASRSADSTSMRVVVGPGVSGVATVTKVGTVANPIIGTQTLATTNAISPVVPAIDLGPALGRTSGVAAGDQIVITAPAGMVFSQTSVVTFATGPIGIFSRSADSTRITVLAGPGLSGVATVTKVGLINGVVLGTFTLSTTNAISPAVPNVTVAPTTVSNAAPSVGTAITVTLGGNLRFIASSRIFIGGIEAGLQSVSADSTTATVMPMMGSNGNITYTGVALSFLTSVPLAVPGDKSVAVSAVYGGGLDPNAGTIGTASTIVLPPVGRSFIFTDSGPFTMSGPCGTISGDGCRFYKFVLTGAATFDAEFRWQGGADMGLYRVNSTGGGATAQGSCDNGGQGASGQPETCTVTGLAAGTYYFAVAFFGTGSGYPPSGNTVAPTFFQFRISSK